MQLADFDYNLPKHLIAQAPTKKRDQSKLLVLDLKNDSIEHLIFNQVIEFLEPNDTLVVNDSRVVNARLFGHKPTGGKVEILILEPNTIINQRNSTDSDILECLIKGKVKPGLEIELKLEPQQNIILKAKIRNRISGGRFKVEFKSDQPLSKILNTYGQLPLPPYIKQQLKVPERYQTIYSKNNGSVAAPTAGLHFTPELIKKIENKGVKIAYITLHINYGTFTPVRSDKISQHKMDHEYAILTKENANIINETHLNNQNSGRLVAVGTTTVRTLETAAINSSFKNNKLKEIEPWEGQTDLFIYPGFKFKSGIDILITNFHLPKSTLLMLVSAFAGREKILRAYQEAIEKQYRFYSLGDAMMIIK